MESVSRQTGHFVHHINPMLAELFGVKLWYYGLAYTLGFLGVFWWFKLAQKRLGWRADDVYDLSILVALSVLFCGRTFEILFYEWKYYREHLSEILSFWRGGMATHGLLLGGVLGIWLFCRIRGKSFLEMADEMAIPGAFLMGLGRIGNFIDGKIVGSVTDVWWAVKFPDAEGFRHPVTLYDGLKNLMMIPLLLLVKRISPPGQGMMLAHFVFWYGFGRFFIDFFREYPTEVLGLGTGQYFNLLMAVGGLALMIWFSGVNRAQNLSEPDRENLWGPLGARGASISAEQPSSTSGLWPRRLIFVALLLFCLIIPTDWTQGTLELYRQRPTTEQTIRHEVRLDAPAGFGESPSAGLP